MPPEKAPFYGYLGPKCDVISSLKGTGTTYYSNAKKQQVL